MEVSARGQMPSQLRTQHPRRAFFVCLLAASLAIGPRAGAEEPPAEVPPEPAPEAPAPEPTDDERAHTLYMNGERLYSEGRYEEAVVAFQAAYDLSQRPLLLFNLANAYERLGQLDDAVDALNRYRVFADPSEQDILLARVQALEQRIAKLAAVQPVPVPLPMPAPEPVPVPIPTTETHERRNNVPWLVAAGGGALAVLGAGTAGATWASSRSILERGDEAAWNRLKPLNNLGIAGGITGGIVGVFGVSWAVYEGQGLRFAPASALPSDR